MRLRKPLLAQVLLFAGLLGAFGFEKFNNSVLHFQEVAGVCVLVLFTWLAFSTKVKKGGSWVIYFPTLLITFLVFFYAYVFYMNTGAPMMPSILAQRERVFFLLAPVVYMLHMRGWRLADFQRIFVFAALLTVVDYSVAYYTIDAESWYNSGDFYKKSMVTWDEGRGYRLKGSLFMAILVTLYFGRRALQTRNLLLSGSRLALTAVPVVLLVVTYSRSTLMSAILALTLYGLLLWRAERLRLSHVTFSILATVTVYWVSDVVASAFTEAFAQDWSYVTRTLTVERAWTGFLEYPIFGFGVGSYHSVTLSDIFGRSFATSDIGLLGVAVEFGAVGVLLYLFFGFWIFVNFFHMLVAYRDDVEPGQRAFLWVLFIMCFTYIIASALQQPLIGGAPDIGIVAFSWGLLLAYKHGLPGGLRGTTASIRAPLSLHTQAKPVASGG